MIPELQKLLESWQAIAGDSRWPSDYRNAHRHCAQELAELIEQHAPQDTTP